MRRIAIALTALALLAPAMACAALHPALDDDVRGPRICARVYFGAGGVEDAYDKYTVNSILPELVRAVSVERGCTFEFSAERQYNGGPYGNTYIVNRMESGWYCSCA